MKSILSLLPLLTLINAGSDTSSSSEDSTACIYEVTVVDAKNLEDMDTDFLWITNYNDVYVEIYGYGSGGDDKMKVLRTSIKEGDDAPEWNEKFEFDNTEDCNGEYTKFLFKLYDDDDYTDKDYFNDPDFLGEAGPIMTSDITSCDSIYSEELKVIKDEEESGTVFVEITKSAACCTGGGAVESEEEEEEKEEKEEKTEKTKGKGRRLLE